MNTNLIIHIDFEEQTVCYLDLVIHNY